MGLLGRFHETLKNEEVYWRLYDSPEHARECLAEFRLHYNNTRPHWALVPPRVEILLWQRRITGLEESAGAFEAIARLEGGWVIEGTSNWFEEGVGEHRGVWWAPISATGAASLATTILGEPGERLYGWYASRVADALLVVSNGEIIPYYPCDSTFFVARLPLDGPFPHDCPGVTTTDIVTEETDVILEDTGRSFEPTTLAEIEEGHVTLVEIDVPSELGLQPVCPE